MNLTSTHYQDILLAEIEKQIVQKGLDGVFLDTVGNINSYLPEDEQKGKMKPCYLLSNKLKTSSRFICCSKLGISNTC